MSSAATVLDIWNSERTLLVSFLNFTIIQASWILHLYLLIAQENWNLFVSWIVCIFKRRSFEIEVIKSWPYIYRIFVHFQMMVCIKLEYITLFIWKINSKFPLLESQLERITLRWISNEFTLKGYHGVLSFRFHSHVEHKSRQWLIVHHRYSFLLAWVFHQYIDRFVINDFKIIHSFDSEQIPTCLFFWCSDINIQFIFGFINYESGSCVLCSLFLFFRNKVDFVIAIVYVSNVLISCGERSWKCYYILFYP